MRRDNRRLGFNVKHGLYFLGGSMSLRGGGGPGVGTSVRSPGIFRAGGCSLRVGGSSLRGGGSSLREGGGPFFKGGSSFRFISCAPSLELVSVRAVDAALDTRMN